MAVDWNGWCEPSGVSEENRTLHSHRASPGFISARYGQLPILTLDDGTEIYQSDAMLRYVASLGGNTYPNDVKKRLEIDVAMGVMADMYRSWGPCLYTAMMPEKYGHFDVDGEKKAALIKRLREDWVAVE